LDHQGVTVMQEAVKDRRRQDVVAKTSSPKTVPPTTSRPDWW
jgi:hypothetical protein